MIEAYSAANGPPHHPRTCFPFPSLMPNNCLTQWGYCFANRLDLGSNEYQWHAVFVKKIYIFKQSF